MICVRWCSPTPMCAIMTSMVAAQDLKLGAFFFGGVEMNDAGAGAPNPMDRRSSNDECWAATLDYVNSAIEAERLGYDSFWTTEHHFQYEGYEVIPNGLLISTWIAAQTTKLRFGAMFNVVPQWNPLPRASRSVRRTTRTSKPQTPSTARSSRSRWRSSGER